MEETKTNSAENKNRKYVIYGSATMGKLVYERLSEAGCVIAGFIDRRADEVKTFMGLPVWDIGNLPGGTAEDTNTAAVVAVKNVFEHTAIANALIKNGFRTIIYMPRSVLDHTAEEDAEIIGALYNKLINGEWKGTEQIPCLYKTERYRFRDTGIAERSGEHVCARIPAEFIFTNPPCGKVMPWNDVSMYMLFTHYGLYDWFSGEESGNYENYIREYCESGAEERGIKATDAWRGNILNNRNDVYEKMENFLETDPDFFVRSAAEAEWNSKGYFNLTSGKHRVSFLISRGYRLIPLKISSDDYDRFLNVHAAEKLARYFDENTVDSISFPVPHPWFYQHANKGNTFYHTVLKKAACIIASEIYSSCGRIDAKDLTVLDMLDDCGTFSRYFSRAGSRVYRFCGNELTRLLDELTNNSQQTFSFSELPDNFSADLLMIDLNKYDYSIFKEKGLRASRILAICSGESLLSELREEFSIERLASYSGNNRICQAYLCELRH